MPTKREIQCATCKNGICYCRTCRGLNAERRKSCECGFSEDTLCAWPEYSKWKETTIPEYQTGKIKDEEEIL